MEPIFLKEVYKDYLWGGNKLKSEYSKDTDLDIVAESWEVAANKNGDNIILNGEYKNKLLSELFKDKDTRELVFGKKCKDMDKFPILIKFIDALKDLSIQVHPNDEYALKYENSFGKNEMWYIMDCEKNSKIVCGLKDSKENLSEILYEDNIEEYLNYINVKKGDTIYIPAGLVHAIKGNIFICEIQQNSDVTYRIYDYNRVDKNGNKRELHTKQALEVINKNIKPNVIEENNDNEQIIINNEYFKVQKIVVNDEYNDVSSKESFYAISILEGSGNIICDNNIYEVIKGKSFIIPSNLGNYTIKGKMKLLKVNI